MRTWSWLYCSVGRVECLSWTGRLLTDDFSEPIPESWREGGGSDGTRGRGRATFTAERSLGRGDGRGEDEERPREKRMVAKFFTVSRFFPFLGECSSHCGISLLSSDENGVGLSLRDGRTNSCENRLAIVVEEQGRKGSLQMPDDKK
jgi:hypothetical protein